jgi:hypothetical protein
VVDDVGGGHGRIATSLAILVGDLVTSVENAIGCGDARSTSSCNHHYSILILYILGHWNESNRAVEVLAIQRVIGTKEASDANDACGTASLLG